uniref:AlNc14C332G10704 protein n=1 Tax=Albugo laibachii Nc14 TaxID=890382 RepID=F0WWU1_9STRA|nr:AlNc14C332G10704 [Albugo laibachii Nc14]|eukprot:CCA25918.1 AlNc14C332G10704 [Albugo laibachii Nc14]
MKALSPTDSVKYLGISFSQSPVGDLMIEFLEDLCYGGFRQCFRRARTIRGRLLVAQPMVLSQFWHFTTHFNIPQHLRGRWQSMLNRFVLSRKYARDSAHVQLIKFKFIYLPPSEIGLQVPLIDIQLKKQRYQFLQNFTLHSSTATPSNWTLNGMEVLRCILPDFGPYRDSISLRYHHVGIRLWFTGV